MCSNMPKKYYSILYINGDVKYDSEVDNIISIDDTQDIYKILTNFYLN